MKQWFERLCKIFCGIGVALICFLLLLPSFPFLPADAQSPTLTDTSREQEIETKIRSFFDTLARVNFSLAFDELLRQSPYGGSFDAGQTSEELRKRMENFSTQYGGILNHEKFDTKRIGDDIVVARYILKYENSPVIWTFVFYRKPAVATGVTNTWMFVQLHFDTDIRLLLR